MTQYQRKGPIFAAVSASAVGGRDRDPRGRIPGEDAGIGAQPIGNLPQAALDLSQVRRYSPTQLYCFNRDLSALRVSRARIDGGFRANLVLRSARC